MNGHCWARFARLEQPVFTPTSYVKQDAPEGEVDLARWRAAQAPAAQVGYGWATLTRGIWPASSRHAVLDFGVLFTYT
jgi:hypothetical protein